MPPGVINPDNPCNMKSPCRGRCRCFISMLPRGSWKYVSNPCVSLASSLPVYVNSLKTRGRERLRKKRCYVLIFGKDKDTSAHRKHPCPFVFIFEFFFFNSWTRTFPSYVTNRKRAGEAGGDGPKLFVPTAQPCVAWLSKPVLFFQTLIFKCSLPSPA